jgi:DNA-binding PadR family transcriptional regulator
MFHTRERHARKLEKLHAIFGHGRHGAAGFGGGRHGRGESGGRRRMFDGGELRLVLLKLIEETPRHGYDLIREIEDRSGGAYAPSPGVIYPTLTLLADMGLIEEAKSEGAKKLFAITHAGSVHLTEKTVARPDGRAQRAHRRGTHPPGNGQFARSAAKPAGARRCDSGNAP